MRVEPGEIHGFPGANRAQDHHVGVMLGLLRKEAGPVELVGLDPLEWCRLPSRRVSSSPAGVTLLRNYIVPPSLESDVVDRTGGLREKASSPVLGACSYLSRSCFLLFAGPPCVAAALFPP